ALSPSLLRSVPCLPLYCSRSVFFFFPALDVSSRNLGQALRFAPPRLPVHLVDLVAVAHQRPREADKLPPNQSCVAAMHRIAEHALNSVTSQHAEEIRVLDGAKLLVLLGRLEVREIAELR